MLPRWSAQLFAALAMSLVVSACAGAGERDIQGASPTMSSAPGPVTDSSASASTALEPSPAPPTPVAQHDGEAVDVDRDRIVPYRVFAPEGASGSTPVVLISHGGFGSERGFTTANHFGEALAEGGFLAVHVGHRESVRADRQLADRPADVTFLLDLLEAGQLTLPDEFGGVADLSRVGHMGHSFGAYTAHALAGASFRQPGGAVTYTDPRIGAIVVLSPQGAGQFGAFIDPDGPTTWTSVEVPVLGIAGSEELDTNALGEFRAERWRLQPFANYPGTADTFMIVIGRADHSDLWRTGGPELERWIAIQVVTFFDTYVRRSPDADACSIGFAPRTDRVATAEHRPAPEGSRLTPCG